MFYKYALALTLITLCIFSLTRANAVDDQIKIKELLNLAQLSEQPLKNKKPILLEFSAEHCPFCVKLEENILKPMIRSGDYKDKIFIRSVDIDNKQDIIGWNGQVISPKDLQKKYNIFVTPTVLLINEQGFEIAERQLGINSIDYYGYYLDLEIEKALEKMR